MNKVKTILIVISLIVSCALAYVVAFTGQDTVEQDSDSIVVAGIDAGIEDAAANVDDSYDAGDEVWFE